MTAVRTLVQVSLLAACAATSFVTVQVIMAAKEEIAEPVELFVEGRFDSRNPYRQR